jgi:3-oxoacyl-[acyl-carrier protein] reductase
MDLGLQGRTAAIAAASSGLGLASAQALAAEGVEVAICGRDRKRIDEAAAKVRETAGRRDAKVVPLVADVADAGQAAGFVAEASAALGSVDILVTNAGGPPGGDFASTEVEAYPDALALNLLSVVALCKAAVPAMRAQRWGRVVAITSVSVRQPIGTLILSNTARAGATGFLKTLAREVAGDGVTVNSVQPGYHATARLKHLGADLDQLASAVPTRTVGDPADFGRVVAFLASDSARYVTGAALPVDGGAYAGLQ